MFKGSNSSFIFDSNFSVGCLQGQILPSNSVSARDSHIKPVFEADEQLMCEMSLNVEFKRLISPLERLFYHVLTCIFYDSYLTFNVGIIFSVKILF
jgi:hypothetical protein